MSNQENQYGIQAKQQAENRELQIRAEESGKWVIEVYLCRGGDFGFKIFSPGGFTAHAFIYPDGRLSEYRECANIEFASEHLRLSSSMVSRLKKAGDEFIKNILPVKFPSEFRELGPYSL